MNAKELLHSKGKTNESRRRSPQARPQDRERLINRAQHKVNRRRVEDQDLQQYNSMSRFEKYTHRSPSRANPHGDKTHELFKRTRADEDRTPP